MDLNGIRIHKLSQASMIVQDGLDMPGPWVRCRIANHKSFQDVFVESQGMEADHVCTSCPKWSISGNQLSDEVIGCGKKRPKRQLFVVE